MMPTPNTTLATLSALGMPPPPAPPQGLFGGAPPQGLFGGAPSTPRNRRTRREGRISKIGFPGATAPADAKLTALTVTVREGDTFDNLFEKVAQRVGEGERAATYSAVSLDPSALQQLVELGAAAPICQVQPDAASLALDLIQLDPASVLFNWECCAGCNNDQFHAESPVPLIAFLLGRGFTVMCSDFSLSALIHGWDAALLGPNPFLKVGEFDSSLTLRFDCDTLKACDDSAQLQVLGELCSTGEAKVHAMSGTKAYVVDPSVREGVRVLTVVTHLDGVPAQTFLDRQRARPGSDGDASAVASQRLSTAGPHAGLAGHAIVEFAGGGRLITSSCHWVELAKLDTDEATLLAVTEERQGSAAAAELRQSLARAPAGSATRAALSASSAAMLVQTSSPARWTPSSRLGP